MTAVSAYVPCYNNAATVRSSVESLLRQTHPPSEVLVLDDGSTDGSAVAVSDLDVRVIRHERNQGRGTARAAAMREARHELVVCCDAALVLEPAFIERALPWFELANVAAVFGRPTQPTARNVAERWRGRHLLRTDLPSSVNRKASLATGGAMLRASAARLAGGYRPALRHSEDVDLGARLLQSGFDVVHDPQLQVTVTGTNTVRTVLERHWRWNAGVSESVNWRAYLKDVAYATKVMAAADLSDGDFASVPISLLSPHYRVWRSWRRRREQTA